MHCYGFCLSKSPETTDCLINLFEAVVEADEPRIGADLSVDPLRHDRRFRGEMRNPTQLLLDTAVAGERIYPKTVRLAAS